MTGRVDATESAPPGQALCRQVTRQSGQTIELCYHCGRCGGGCPVAKPAGMTPEEFLWLIQFGLADQAVASPLLWLCVGCGTCGARCPNQISTNEVIDSLRAATADSQSIAKQVKAVRTFHKLLVRQVRRRGRLHELSLIAALRLRTLTFFKDIVLGRRMLLRGKIPILPHKLAGVAEIKSLLAKLAERETSGE